MGSCCLKKPRAVAHPESVTKSITDSKSLKKIPTVIKIIPASPEQISLQEDDSLNSPEPKSEPQNKPDKTEKKNLLTLLKTPLTASQSLKSNKDRDVVKRKLINTYSLEIPGKPINSLVSSSSNLSEYSDDNVYVPNHRRRCSDQTHSKFSIEFSDSGNNIHTRNIQKSKSLDGKKKINQYTFLGLIGRGAFGKVFKVVDDKMNYAAAKTYNKRILLTRWIGKKRTGMDSVKSEIEIMMKLEHPNTIKLIEVIDDENSYKMYLIMELAGSGSVYELCPIPEEKCKKYFRELMLGVEYLHNVKSIVHRDIKPQNLLITDEDQLKICDFGGAQFVNEMKDELTNSSGTFMFMPPEAHRQGNFRGKPADIWACGITLYFMLTKSSPFINKSYSALLDEINQSNVTLPENFSDTLQDLMQKMTLKDPFTRISADEILNHPWLAK